MNRKLFSLLVTYIYMHLKLRENLISKNTADKSNKYPNQQSKRTSIHGDNNRLFVMAETIT